MKSDTTTSTMHGDSKVDDFFAPENEKPPAADDFFDDGMSQKDPLKGNSDSPSGVRVVRGRSGYWGQFAVSPDGRFIASGSDDHTVLFWDLETGRELWKSRPFDSMLFALSFSPKGDQIWAASRTTAVRFDATSGSVGQEFSFKSSEGGATAFNSACSRLAVCGKGWVRIYDTRLGNESAIFQNMWVPAITFRKSSADVFLGGNEGDGRISLGQVARKKIAKSFAGMRDRTICLKSSRSGRYLAASSGPCLPKQHPPQNVVAVCDVDSGRLVQRFQIPTGWQRGLSFSPDEKWLASGGSGSNEDWNGHRSGADNLIRVWSVETGQELRRLVGHTAAVLWTDFSPDGKMLISSGADSTIRIWKLE